MPVPDFQSLMLPALKALADGAETPISVVYARIAAAEELTPEDTRELFPSSRQRVFVNRIGWAVTYLGRAGLTERVRRGVWQLTAEGERLLADPPSSIDMNHLRKYPAYVAWRTGKNEPSSTGDALSSISDGSTDTPEEVLDRANLQLHVALEADVLKAG